MWSVGGRPDRSTERGGPEGGEGHGRAGLGGFPGVHLAGVDADAGGVRADVADAQVEELPAGRLAATDLAEHVQRGVLRVVLLTVGDDGDQNPPALAVRPLVAAGELQGCGDGVEQRGAAAGGVVVPS